RLRMSSTVDWAVSWRLVASMSLNSTTSPGAIVIAGGQALSQAGRCWSRWIVWLRPFTWTVSVMGALLWAESAPLVPERAGCGPEPAVARLRPVDSEKYGFSQA